MDDNTPLIIFGSILAAVLLGMLVIWFMKNRPGEPEVPLTVSAPRPRQAPREPTSLNQLNELAPTRRTATDTATDPAPLRLSEDTPAPSSPAPLSDSTDTPPAEPTPARIEVTTTSVSEKVRALRYYVENPQRDRWTSAMAETDAFALAQRALEDPTLVDEAYIEILSTETLLTANNALSTAESVGRDTGFSLTDPKFFTPVHHARASRLAHTL